MGVFTPDFDVSKEFIDGCTYGRLCIEVSVVILAKVGGGPGGDAAWMAEAMLIEPNQ